MQSQRLRKQSEYPRRIGSLYFVHLGIMDNTTLHTTNNYHCCANVVMCMGVLTFDYNTVLRVVYNSAAVLHYS